MLAGLQSDRARMKRAYQRSVEYACLLLYPCFVGIAVVSPELVTIVFGRHWAPVVPLVAALAMLTLLQAPRLFTTPVLTAVGRPRDTLIGIAIELAFMLTMIGVFGLHSLLWATALWIASECTQIPVTAWMLRRATGFNFVDQFAGAMSPLLASMVLACSVLAVRRLLPPNLSVEPRLAILVAVGAVAYLIALVFLNRRLVSTFSRFRAFSLCQSAWLRRSRAVVYRRSAGQQGDSDEPHWDHSEGCGSDAVPDSRAAISRIPGRGFHPVGRAATDTHAALPHGGLRGSYRPQHTGAHGISVGFHNRSILPG